MGTGAQKLITAPPHVGAACVDMRSFLVYHALVSFTRFLTFCYRMHSAGGGSGTGAWDGLFPPSAASQAPQWAERGLSHWRPPWPDCQQTEGRSSRGGCDPEAGDLVVVGVLRDKEGLREETARTGK